MRLKKSQASLEMLFALIIIIIIFSATALFFYNRSQETVATEAFLEKRNLCFKLADNINSIFTNGDGAMVRIDHISYDVTFNGDERAIFVEDTSCSIPIKEITNGVSSEFTIPPSQTIQMENRDNVVYISSNCLIDIPLYAEASSTEPGEPNIVTNLVRRDDNKYADVFLPHIYSRDILDIGQYLEEQDIRMAYIRVGQHCSNPAFDGLWGSYGCVKYSQQPDFSGTRCDIYQDVPDLNIFFSKDYYRNYTLMVFENTELTDPQIDELEADIPNSKYAFFTGKISQSVLPLQSGEVFNVMYYETNPNADGPATVQPYEDNFFQLISGNQYYLLGSNMEAVKNVNNIPKYVRIADFSEPLIPPIGLDSMARWDFGDGTIYYLSNVCEEDIIAELGKSIRKIIGAVGVGKLYAEFELNSLLGDDFEKNESRIFISHKEDRVNITIFNITYNDGGAWTSVCGNISGSLSEKRDSCNYTSDKEEIKTEIYFAAGIKDLKKAAHVDVEYIQVCYNETK